MKSVTIRFENDHEFEQAKQNWAEANVVQRLSFNAWAVQRMLSPVKHTSKLKKKP